MKARSIQTAISTAALAISLLGIDVVAQTSGQMKAVQSLASQAKSPAGGAPAAAPRSSAPAPAARPASQAAAPQKSPAPAAAQAAPKSPAPANSSPASGAGSPSAQAASNNGPATNASPGVRRDPFRPLIIKGKGDEIPARLPPGKAGLVIGQLTIQGIVRGLDGQWVAVADNKTKRAYFLYKGDDLYNGSVSRITENTVVFAERITDPTGKQTTREVVKQLVR